LISIRRMSLGAGFRCLTSSVAVGDDAPGKSNNLTRYYAESGTLRASSSVRGWLVSLTVKGSRRDPS